MIFGGEALELREPARRGSTRHGDERPQLVNMYGITETTVHVTYRAADARPTCERARAAPIGGPIPDLQRLRARRAAGSRCRSGVPGELYVGGAGRGARLPRTGRS